MSIEAIYYLQEQVGSVRRMKMVGRRPSLWCWRAEYGGNDLGAFLEREETVEAIPRRANTARKWGEADADYRQ